MCGEILRNREMKHIKYKEKAIAALRYIICLKRINPMRHLYYFARNHRPMKSSSERIDSSFYW